MLQIADRDDGTQPSATFFFQTKICAFFEVPITTIEEQTLIVHEIELKLSHTDELISQIEDHLEKVEALRQSILKKALAGQLVGQDLHDEPASVLLGRIRAERERAIQNTKKTTKRRTTA